MASLFGFLCRVAGVTLATLGYVLRLAAVLAVTGWPLVALVAAADQAGEAARTMERLRAAAAGPR